MKQALIGIAVTVLTVIGIPSFGVAEVKKVSGEAGIERIFGYTQYRIGGKVTPAKGKAGTLHYPVSELQFPLDVYWLSIGGMVKFTDDVRANGSFKTNVNRDAGKMKDSDWGYWYLQGKTWADYRTLDVYSLSDASLKGYILDADIQFRAFEMEPFTLHLGVGFMYQYFGYDISNLDQWYPSYNTYRAYLSPTYSNHDYVRDLIMTYTVEYFIPYLELVPELKVGAAALLSAQLGLAPYVIARDVDDHILRSKVMDGSATGWAFMASIKGEYYIDKTVSVSLAAGYLWIWTKGKQSQSFYETTDESTAGYIGTIENRIITEQYYVRIGAAYAFK
ncbi:MAG TPA: omptin family outer membrane protease [Spirochaetota bacterium]|nr:omptin family outer membrane protease [Spirochaetota bacterium]HOS40281.1 omptin family outer membrane protease [Spirochaetota bacterium]HPU88868.1 omptin family outer membrane protease [Spirochaetota bacterium]